MKTVIFSISTGPRSLPIKCIKGYGIHKKIIYATSLEDSLYSYTYIMYIYINHIYIYIDIWHTKKWPDVYFLLFGSSLKCSYQKIPSEMLVKTPCLHLCVAKHQTACTIRLIFLRYVGWYIGQKTWNNRKTKKHSSLFKTWGTCYFNWFVC